jgi:hypothetical protein
MGYPYSVFSDEKTVPYSADEDDFMLLVHNNQAYAVAPATPSGWTAVTYTSVIASGTYNNIWYRKATASEPTSVTVDASPSLNKQSLQLTVYKGIDTTTPFDTTVTSRSSGAASINSCPAITPATDNALIVYINIPNNDGMVPTPGPLKIERTRNSIQHGAINTYYTYGKAASVAVAAHEFWSEKNANINATCVTIALRDDGGGTQAGYVDKTLPPAQILHILGEDSETGHLTGTTPQKNVSGTITSLQGVTTTNNTNNYLGGTAHPEFESGITSTGYSLNSPTQPCAVLGSEVVAAYNLENEIISFSSVGPPIMYASYSGLAKHFGLGDGTNYRLWKVDAVNTIPSGADAPIVCVIEVDGGFESEEYGTVTSGVLQALDEVVMGGPAPTTYNGCSYGFLYKLNTMLILGGSTVVPASMSIAAQCARTSSLRTVNNQGQQSDTQFFSAHKIQVGDGTTKTVWSNEGHAIESPSASNTTDRKIQVQVTSGNFGISWKASASCNFDIRGTFGGGNLSPWGFESGTSTSATYTENPTKVQSHAPTLQDIGRAWAGLSFIGCSRLELNGADISGGSCVIENSLDATSSITPLAAATQAALQLLLDDIASTSFTTNPVAIRIEYTGASAPAVNFDAIIVSGNTVDLHFNATNAVQLTANMQNGSNITTTATSGSATGVTIANDITATINVNVTGAEITILTAGTQTELFHVETGTTSEAYVYTYSSDFNGDIQVYKPGYKPYWLASNVFSNSNQTITVNLDEDPASQI